MIDLAIYNYENNIVKFIQTKVGERFFVVKDSFAEYVGLFDKLFLKHPIMSNAIFEKENNYQIIKEAKGDVLIAGLGIGLIVLPIMNKPDVNSIEIVELHKEVIDLVASQLPLNSKVKIINENIFTFQPIHKYDTIYFDTISQFSITESELLDRTRSGYILTDRDMVIPYQEYLNEGGFIKCFEA